MLVLSRKLNEEIVIAGNIRIKVLEVSGNRVRLGVDAPAQVPIARQELLAFTEKTGCHSNSLQRHAVVQR